MQSQSTAALAHLEMSPTDLRLVSLLLKPETNQEICCVKTVDTNEYVIK